MLKWGEMLVERQRHTSLEYVILKMEEKTKSLLTGLSEQLDTHVNSASQIVILPWCSNCIQ